MGVRKLIERQELFVLSGTSPAKLSAEHVETVRMLRRETILHELGRKQKTPVHLAREARQVLFPSYLGANLPQHRAEEQRRRLSLVSSEARQLFGVASLTAACSGSGCRWCLAGEFARLLGGWAPTAYSEGFRELFGAEPCAKCGPQLYGSVMASLAARVHPVGVRPSEPALRPSAAERERAQEWVQQRAVTAAARPVQDDDGRGLVSRRRREVQARLKAANRARDTVYAAQLVRQLEGLRADAAAVDGRAAAPRGRKACGTPVGVRCECHTSDRRGRS